MNVNENSGIKSHFDIFIHSYALALATGLSMHSITDLLFNQEEIDK
jgi:hypothetical protein